MTPARLSQLKRGQRATVTALLCADGVRRRLLDMGLCRGATVECVGYSPMGDPKAYLVCGAVVALRRTDSENITVENIV